MNLIKRTNVKLTTEPHITYTLCYMQCGFKAETLIREINLFVLFLCDGKLKFEYLYINIYNKLFKSMELRKFIATTIREYLNEQKEIESNLNDNFKKWFGNSITVKGGKPNIFYHFSNENFNSFERKSGINTHLFSTEVVNREAFFFTTDINFASQYGSKKYEVYLKINNIFDFNKHYYYKDISPTTSDFFDEIIDNIEYNGIDMNMEYQSYRGELKIKPEHNWKFFDSKIGKLFVDYLKNNGYDGAYFIEEGSPIYVVFNSNQIKSVENDGTWDIGDDNIFS